MGYYTRHNLEIIKGCTGLISELRDSCDDAKYSFGDDGRCEESTKWYSHEEDLISFSKKHPEAIFLLHGEGEENLDVWREYYKNGRVQVCKAIISFDDFNENKLR